MSSDRLRALPPLVDLLGSDSVQLAILREELAAVRRAHDDLQRQVEALSAADRARDGMKREIDKLKVALSASKARRADALMVAKLLVIATSGSGMTERERAQKLAQAVRAANELIALAQRDDHEARGEPKK